MPAPLTLPRLSWGDPHATTHALLVHGLGSNGALMWLYGVALADAGWHATAVDLRGHGTAPRAVDYSIAAYAADLVHTAAPDGEPWDLVVGHSLGGAAATSASAATPAWTRRLVLVDPADPARHGGPVGALDLDEPADVAPEVLGRGERARDTRGAHLEGVGLRAEEVAVLRYLDDLLHGRERRYLGHNPAGGAMIVALLAVIAA